MKKFIPFVLIIIMTITSFGCASDKAMDYKNPKNGQVSKVTFETYGLFSLEKKNPDIHYRLAWGNIVWSVILFETVFIPIILIGWYLYEPVNQIPNDSPIGSY